MPTPIEPVSTDPSTEPPVYRYRFGAAEFDEVRFELMLDGQPVDLEHKPLQVLAELLHHVGEVVTRDELLDSVWAGRPTVDNVLPNAVAKLRKALGPALAERIVTLPRLGYRLNGPVERIASGRRLSSRLHLADAQVVPHRPDWVLERQLNPSRASEVWLARHVRSREPRVFKFAGEGERLSMLKREATLHRVLTESLGDREDIARVLDWNFETPPFFLECEYGGDSLQAWVQAGHLAALDRKARLTLFLGVAQAVSAAHGVGVLHKDIKPANVLVAARAEGGWRVRLTDFGSARLLHPERLAELGITRLGLTLTQALDPDSSGTPLYLAPEVIAGQPPTVRSDVYALGLLLYQLLAGDLRRPLAPGWEAAVDDALLAQTIAAATDVDPARRLPTAAALIEQLSSLDDRRAAAAQALDDSMVAVFDAKYHHHFWRPATAIRNGDIDGNDATDRDAAWVPLIDAPMHPEYPSGHAILAGALGAVLRADVGNTPPVPLVTHSPTAKGAARQWSRVDDFVREVGDSRIWAGIHYRSAIDAATQMGERIGTLAAAQLLRQPH